MMCKIPFSFSNIRIVHTGWPKKSGTIFSVHLNFTKYYRFSILFHCQNQKKICNNTVAKDPTTPYYTTLWNVSVIKTTIENKTSVTTHFKKLTTGNNMIIVSVIVWSNCHILQVLQKHSMCPPCCATTHSSRRCHWSMMRSVKVSYFWWS